MVGSSARRRRAVRWAAGLTGFAGVLLVVAALALGRSSAADDPPPPDAQTGASVARSQPASGAVAAAVARRHLGWVDTRAQREVAAYRAYVARFRPRALAAV